VIGIFTNLTPEHLDYHGNMMQYAAAKAKLFKISKISVINADDSYGKFMYDQATGEKYTYSRESAYADFTAQNVIGHGIKGSEYDLVSENEAIHVECAIPGSFSVSNSLAAAVAARLVGASCKDVALAIRRLPGVSGRMEKVPLSADFTVIIDYAHTPDALENVLKTIRAFKTPSQRLVALFGCGGDRDKTKRPIMGGIAAAMADFTVVTSDNSRTEDPSAIIEDILKGIPSDSDYKVIENRTEALCWVVENAMKDDIIVVAGKGHENYEITATGKHPFSEKEIIQKAFEQRKR
jgi:UDP-N-acetylmuramoyl-L-alanyl-D-glutamate--2,6-diaminopimelate ligase